ncbi:Double homeobox protein 4 [Allomyces arbusculus]|nr:Double homeobox protein 4 [Allomyces arbusculus]
MDALLPPAMALPLCPLDLFDASLTDANLNAMPLTPSSSFDLALPPLFPSSCSSLPHPAGPEGPFGSMVPASAPAAAGVAASTAMMDCWSVPNGHAAAAAHAHVHAHGPAVPAPRPSVTTTITTTTTTTPSTLLAAPTTADVAAASWMTSFLPTPFAETAPTGRSATATDALDAAARLPFMAPPSNAPLVLHHPFMPFADQYVKPEQATAAAAAPANKVAPVVVKKEHVPAAPPSPLPSPRPSPASSNATRHLAATSDDDTTSTAATASAAAVATSEKPRSRLTREQTAILKRVYAVTYFPDRATKEQLAGELGIPVRTVQIWFQNQRQYHRIKLKKKAAKAKASGASGDLESAAITKVALPRVKSTASASPKAATPALVELRPAATTAPPTPVPTPTLPALAPLLARRASAPVAASRIPLPVPPAAPLGLPTVLPMTPTSPLDHAWHAPAPLVAPAPPPAAPAPEFQLDYVAFEALLNTYPASANAAAHENAHWMPMTTQSQSQSQQYSTTTVPRQRAYSWMQ